MILENLYTLQFLYINKYRFLQGWSDYDGGVLFSIIRYIIKGSGEFTINGENYRVQEGDILCIPQNATLVSEAMDSNIEFISLRFRADIHKYGELQKLLMIDLPNHIRFDDATIRKLCGNLFVNMNDLFIRDEVGQNYKLLGQLYYLIGTIKSHLKDTVITQKVVPQLETNHNNDRRIIQTIEYIKNNLSTAHHIATLASMVDLSESQFRLLFKSFTGKSPRTYIYEYKMTSAVELLLHTNLKINEIALQVGYEDANYFTRQFKYVYGLSPRAYRNYRN